MSFSLLSRRICTRRLQITRSFATSHKPITFLPGRFAFALDIDGVLLRGPEPHPSAKKALTKLQENDIPFILLTNGGGVSEAARSEDLSSRLDFPIAPSQIIQSHTPVKSFAKTYKTILVVGGEGENCRRVAEEYGFENVFIPDDFLATNPSISPFSTSPPPAYARNVPEGTKIDAIFVFNDPRDWALNIQLVVDILRSDNGVHGTLAKPGSRKSVPVFYTNTDLVWASQYHIPRLGQGAFKFAIDSIMNRFPEVRGRMRSEILGKPYLQTFKYAQRLLIENIVAKLEETSPELEFSEGLALGPGEEEFGKAVSADTSASANAAAPEDATPPPPAGLFPEDAPAEESSPSTEAEASAALDAANQPLKRPPRPPAILRRVYMVGDNPESDIKGLKRHGYPRTVWWGLLVRSGVWREPQDTRNPIAIVDDVLAAVDWAIENEQKIKDGVALEHYPWYSQSSRKPRQKGGKISPLGRRKAEAGEAEGGNSASLEKKADSAMKEMKGNGSLGEKEADGESSSSSGQAN